MDNIEEGHDVYFTCLVDSNPAPKIINWSFNVSLILLVQVVPENWSSVVLRMINNTSFLRQPVYEWSLL